MKKGYIFDLDGVITETAQLHYEAWKIEVKKIGIEFKLEENAKLKGLPRLNTLIEILKMHKMENKFSKEELIKMSDSKNIYYVKSLETQVSKKNILPNIEKLLKDIKLHGGKMAIASSSHNAPLILKKVGLLKYFEFIVDPNNIENGKPAPDIYLAAAKGINLPIDKCVGFEDAIAGVIGLKKSGIKTIAITWGDKANWDIADVIYTNTNELKFSEISK